MTPSESITKEQEGQRTENEKCHASPSCKHSGGDWCDWCSAQLDDAGNAIPEETGLVEVQPLSLDAIRCEIAGEGWYDFDKVEFANSITGLTVGDLRRVLASVPSQIEAAVKAEREACMTLARPEYDLLSPEVNAERGRIAAAIRSRGETA